GPRAWFPYGRSVRPAIAQTRRHRYSHSCVEPSLWLRHRFHKSRPGFETHRRRGPSNGIDKATLAARLLGHCRREHARPLFWGQAYLSVADAYLFNWKRSDDCIWSLMTAVTSLQSAKT